MLDEPTYEKMIQMRMRGLAEAWLAQQHDPDVAQLSFDERLGLLIDAEWMQRENKKMQRSLRAAKLRLSSACIEDIDYPAARKLDKKLIRQLATCKWITLHQNIVITGMTGVGKSYIACALGQQACRKGHRVLYRRVSRLFDELALAHADGSYPRLLATLAKTDVLILDDWGLAPVGPRERRDLNEIMDDRYGSRSTSSPASSPRRPGTTSWELPLPPTRSVIVSSATRTASSSRGRHAASRRATSRSKPQNPSVASLRSRRRR